MTLQERCLSFPVDFGVEPDFAIDLNNVVGGGGVLAHAGICLPGVRGPAEYRCGSGQPQRSASSGVRAGSARLAALLVVRRSRKDECVEANLCPCGPVGRAAAWFSTGVEIELGLGYN